MTPAAKDLAEFVVAHLDMHRIKFIELQTGQQAQSSTLEHTLAERRQRKPDDLQPRPRTRLWIEGKHFGEHTIGDDIFFASFGVYALASGARMLQAVPFIYKGPTDDMEAASHRATVQELFDNERLTNLDRINFAMLDTQGSAQLMLRPFNRQAFGGDILSILDYISEPTQEPSNIQIADGYVKEFPQ